MSHLADYQWLTSPAAAKVLHEAAADPRPLLQRIASLRAALAPERARLVVELIEQRRSGEAKFGPLAAHLFGKSKQWEQATDGWIAAYKADRFATAAPAGVHDFCCGMGGDLLALAQRLPTVGWDRDDVAAHFATTNLKVASEIAEVFKPSATCRRDAPPQVKCVDVATSRPAATEAWHVDPDRRSDGRRTTKPELHAPPPEVIERWRASCPRGAVKLAPATRPWDAWAEAAEWEWISRDRECKQAVAWFGDLRSSTEPGMRRATRITPAEGDLFAYDTATFAAQREDVAAAADAPGAYLADPDPAVIAAELVGALANRERLATLGASSVYLTGDHLPQSPLLTVFHVEAVLRLRAKEIGAYLADHDVGAVEVKVRGVGHDPAAFRRQLRLSGEESATVFLTRIGRREVALVAKRTMGERGA